MTPPKINKFKYLDNNPNSRANRRLVGVISVLSNILTSAIAGEEVGPRGQAFMAKVLDAFDETYEEGSFPARTALRKLYCVEKYAEANERPQASARAKGIKVIINKINAWKLHKGRALKQWEAAKLLERQPKGRNKQTSSLHWALEQSGYMFGKHYGDSYKRHKRRRADLEREVAYHYGNEIDPVNVAFVLLQEILSIKGDLLKGMLKTLWKHDYDKVQVPANSGYAADSFFNPGIRQTLTALSGMDKNLADRRRFGLW